MRKSISLRLFAFLLAIVAAALLLGGLQLITLGGSWYYLLAGFALLISSVLLWQHRPAGSWVYGGLLLATLLWSYWEVGADGWALAPRLLPLMVLGLYLLMPWVRAALHSGNPPPLLAGPASWLGSAAVVLLLAGPFIVSARPDAPSAMRTADTQSPANTRGDWPAYGNTRAGTRYSPLDQITAENVSDLEVAWKVRTGLGGVAKGTPIQVNDMLYVCGAGNVVLGLDAEDGSERWRFDPQINPAHLDTARYFTTTCRGVSYHRAPADYQGECPERILTATADARLLAIDAHTGAACRNFGENGAVDLTRKMGLKAPIYYFVTSPPAIVRGNAVVGGWVLDNREVGEPSGVVRAFDALTGEFSWAWDMGRPGINTEPPEGEVYTRGTPNVWSIFSVDEERGWIYAPTGNETPDYFGAHRQEASEKYASSVVALDGEDGSVQWSFQTVHHDIWDYDVPSQPVLIDLPAEDGSVVPALLQPTKRGEVFMLNRVTGEPIAEVEERLVPQGGVPEDWTSPTQPFSVGMPHFREDLREADMWGISPLDQLWCRIEYRKMRYEGHFTPPSTRLTLQFPGNAGGFNWGSVAVDEANHLMIASPMIMANQLRLIPRAEMDAGAEGSLQLGTPYGASTRMFLSPLEVPCLKPPYGVLAVVDLKTRQMVWKRPIGNANDSGPLGLKLGLPIPVGTPLSAGSIVTRGGLIFIGGTMDSTLHAVNVKTGEEVWSYRLPTTAQATPMSYLSPRSKRQTLVITTPVWGRTGAGGARTQSAGEEDPEGGYVIAFRLRGDQ
ncbi:membrane-bound PQQ-dependent dehydrogenase, glucose/quinate/shikimate family [Gilvimarinus sp. F26214L]|uniref:membrane-bound PQQ-dependent dehydrogenase, glucose/quinate/shikimate family n=1 Tax=Gilvimarinus sp. DZF01 TaxID=3461371 RepID=UPI004045F394